MDEDITPDPFPPRRTTLAELPWQEANPCGIRFDAPVEQTGDECDAFDVWKIDNTATLKTAYVKSGWVLSYDKVADDIAYWPPTVSGAGTMATTAVIVSVSHTIYCKVTTDENDVVTGADIISHTGDAPVNKLADAGTLTDGEYWYQIADFHADAGGFVTVKNQYQHGSPIIHRKLGTDGEPGADGASVATKQDGTTIKAATTFINILGTGDKACSDVLEFVASDAGTDLGMKGGGTPDKGKVVTYSGTKWTVNYVKLVDI